MEQILCGTCLKPVEKPLMRDNEPICHECDREIEMTISYALDMSYEIALQRAAMPLSPVVAWKKAAGGMQA